MKRIKTAVMVGASVASIGIAGVGVASAATTSTTNTDPSSSLVDEIASKFNLDKTKVQAVFDQDRADHKAQMQTKRAAALKQAVTDGKLTQAQADHMTAAWADIDKLMDGTSPDKQSDATRTAIKQKMDDLRTWEKAQNLDLRSIVELGGPGHGHGVLAAWVTMKAHLRLIQQPTSFDPEST